MMSKKSLSTQQIAGLLRTLNLRFQKHMTHHNGHDWAAVLARLEASPEKLWSLNQMEETGGEPDVIGQDPRTGEFLYCDCASETPIGRRGLCYDREALDARKEHKPGNNVLDLATEMGVELLSEAQYRHLQTLGTFDAKTSSWIKTPAPIRELGGALFGDFRYGQVFIYHNGAQSYYAARGFRGLLRV